MKYSNPMYLPKPEDVELNVLNRNTLEISYCYRRDTNTTPLKWNFVNNGVFTPPSNLSVWVNGVSVNISSYSFKRRPIYVPLKVRDLRIMNWLYIMVNSNIPDGATVIVKDSSGATLKNDLTTTKDPNRITPLIHIAQAGYNSGFIKRAIIEHYIGNNGELDLSYLSNFNILDTNNNIVFTGLLTPKSDVGYNFNPLPYQKCLVADFTSFNTSGRYKIAIGDLGRSYEFNISNQTFLGFSRCVALGLLNQRCGYQVKKPYSRHEKNACHTKPAYIPIPDINFPETWSMISSETNPPITSASNLKYPFIKTGTVDVSKGHADAGDYSKYSVNSAMFIHTIICGVDNLKLDTDNLNLPESNNSKSDLLEIAKWEADFLYKMFDDDFGVFHLVYPRYFAYELSNSLQENDFGADQCIWIKTTIATASAVGALAEIGSSPLFRQQFGVAEGDKYINRAKQGWAFLINAINKYGFDGSFERVRGGEDSHLGAMCYAACSLFTATGDIQYSNKLYSWQNSSQGIAWRWGWKYQSGFMGCMTRNYAFASRSGRRNLNELDSTYLQGCESHILKAADNCVRDSNNSAFGGLINLETKGYGASSFGWYFISEYAYDLAIGYALNPKQEYINAGVLSYGYIVGCNPSNISSLSGIGLKRPRIYVSQYQINDILQRQLPPNGQFRASVSAGLPYLELYKNPDNTGELTPLVYPLEYTMTNQYFPENRSESDTYQIMDEITLCQGHSRGIVFAAWLLKLVQ